MYILMGLRYDEAMIQSVRKEVSEMEESITYQEILKKGEAKGEARGEARGVAKGRLEEARELLVLMGKERLGAPDAASRRKLRAIDNLDRLHELALVIGKARSWKDLLQ